MPIHKNLKLGVAALNRVAAFASIGAKRPQWQVEQEFRHATVLHPDSRIKPSERRSGEKIIRYLPVMVRGEGKRIAFKEIIMGSNQDSESGRSRLMQLLADTGYTAGDIEYPNITVSAIPRRDWGAGAA